MCSTLRRTSRALSQVYEDALRPLGLRTTQFTILQVLAFAGEVTQGELGRMLAMDSTTLTRALEIMIRQRWVSKRHGQDRREWRLRLLKAGNTQLARAMPHWERAQAQLLAKLGNDRWDILMKLSNQAANAVTQQGVSS
jgi:DNA-binding MarR family transcriptional regulator